MISQYVKCERGSFNIFAATSISLLMLGAGVAIDYSGQASAESKLQQALDAAVLSAGAVETNNHTRKIKQGKRVLKDNLKGSTSVKLQNVDIQVSSSGGIHGTADGYYEATLLRIFGYKNLPISAKAATEATSGSAEVVLVLDYSSSMNSQYQPMRDAAISLVNDISANGARAEVKVGLVPFAQEVHVSMDGKYAVSGTNGTPWSGCTMSRKWPFVISDSTPTSAMNSKWGHDSSDCDKYVDHNLTVSPLTSSHADTIQQLQIMTPHSGTNTSVGMEIGYQMISPNLPFAASNYNSDVQKFIIVLSDGEQNEPSYGPGDVFSSHNAELNLQSVCDNAKDDGVVVITVIYETNSSRVCGHLGFPLV